MQYGLIIYLTLIGLCVGSFLNVVVYRLPLMLSGKRPELTLNTPASTCPYCGHAIRWRDNIPVISWLQLKGRCRDCNVAISMRYPTVELVTGILAYYSFSYAGITVSATLVFFLCCTLLAATLINYDKACASQK